MPFAVHKVKGMNKKAQVSQEAEIYHVRSCNICFGLVLWVFFL